MTQAPLWVRLVRRAATLSAVLAGIILCLVIITIVLSIAGRTLARQPVPGDFEIVEFATALVVFLSLPYCQIQREQLLADFFTSTVSRPVRLALDAFSALLALPVALLLAWRMGAGLVDAFTYGDVTMILGIPLWWAFPVAVASFLLLAAACLATLAQDLSGHRW